MIVRITNAKRSRAVCRYEKPNRSVKSGPRTSVNTPMNERIVNTIPMMPLLRLQRYNHSAARIL